MLFRSVVDTMNHRVQKFTAEGNFISTFGEQGYGNGQFDMPWGIALDPDDGSIVIGDWRNDRVRSEELRVGKSRRSRWSPYH